MADDTGSMPSEQSPSAQAGDTVLTDLTAHTFDGFVRDNDPAIVEFGAAWCDGCQELAADLADLARETGVAVGTVDIDDHPEVLADQQGLLRGIVAKHVHPMLTVRAIPAVMVFEDGELVEHYQGDESQAVLSRVDGDAP